MIDDDAQAFLDMLGDKHSFQTFDDTPQKRRRLTTVIHGRLLEHRHRLTELNERKAGVFVMVNEGDGRGRSARNVTRVRALFVDLDGAPILPVRNAALKPHCIVESSPQRYHAYWLVSDVPMDAFRQLQHRLALLYSGDRHVCDLPRVMRIPDFFHHKAKAWRTRIDVINEDLKPYAHQEFIHCLPVDPRSEPHRPTLDADHCQGLITEGHRNASLFEMARGLARRGFDTDAITRRLSTINSHRCHPALEVAEVRGIAESASKNPSTGFVKLPHALLDSHAWKACSRSTHEVVVMAFRRFNGSNNGSIALTWSDFAGREGFAQKRAFYRSRREAEVVGFIRKTARGKQTNKGVMPDLYAIEERWLHEPARVEIGTLRKGRNRNPYVDAQSIEVSGKNTDEAA